MTFPDGADNRLEARVEKGGVELVIVDVLSKLRSELHLT